MHSRPMVQQRLLATIFVSAAIAFMPTELLTAASGVHGRVTGYDDAGELLGVVPNAKIVIESAAGTKIAETTSDKNGYYKLDLPTGQYVYKIQAAGYRTEEAGRGLRLTQSQGFAVFNFSLTKGADDPNRQPPKQPLKQTGKLRGRVLEKVKDKLIGIAAAQVVLRREGSTALDAVYTRSTEDGQRHVGDFETELEVGIYRASVIASGFETFVSPEPVEIKRGGPGTERDFVLQRPAPPPVEDQGIRGAVTIIDSLSTRPPIKLQIVPLDGSQREPIDVPLSANGAFRQELPEGSYRAIASAEGFPSAISPPEFVLSQRFTTVNLAIRARHVPEPQTRVEVFVFTRTKDHPEPIPLSSVHVSLLKSGAAPQTAMEGTTDATGHAIFALSQRGDYEASAFLKGYVSRSSAQGTAGPVATAGTGTIELGQSHEVAIELVKQEAAPTTDLKLTVIVNDAVTKRPLAGADVLARFQQEPLAEAARGRTDSAGTAVLPLKHTGSTTVLVRLNGYSPGGAQTEIASQSLNRVVVSLQPLTSPSVTKPEPPTSETDRSVPLPLMTGYVAYREASGQLRAVPGSKLIWQRITPASPPLSELATSGADGRYRVGVPVGTYQVRVEPPAGFEGLTEYVQASSTNQEKYFIVRRLEQKPPSEETSPGSFHANLQVVERGRGGIGSMRAVADAIVHISRDKREIATGKTNQSGQYSILLQPGPYLVRVEKTGYASAIAAINISRSDVSEQIVLNAQEKPPQDLAHVATLTVRVSQRSPERPMMIKPIGTPIAGAYVVVMLGANRVSSGVTNAAGIISVPLAAGNYSVKVEAAGFAPAGKTISLTNRDAQLEFLLERRDGTFRGETILPLDRRLPESIETGPNARQLLKPDGFGLARYVVEYRLNPHAAWTTIAIKSTEREANAALFLAIDRGQIPATAETRIRAERAREKFLPR